MISFTQKGDFSKLTNWLERIKEKIKSGKLNKYGDMGVEALRAATPKDTGLTADAWYYEIQNDRNGLSIVWNNWNVNQGVNIAVILQYGHGTGWGGYVVGRDYINPAIKPVFEQIANDLWKEVTDV